MLCLTPTFTHLEDQLKDTLEVAGIVLLLLSIYVDDIRAFMEKIKLGYRWNSESGKPIYNKEWELEERSLEMSEDKKTATELQRIMNQITPDPRFTLEIQEEYLNNHIPTLDCNVKLIEQINECPKYNIRYTFFKKPMVSQYAGLETSAMDYESKKSTLSQGDSVI